MNREKLKGMNLNLLLTLDAILRHRSLTRAATELKVTQGAVSQSLARLREFFDDPLLVKTGYGMKSTVLGENLHEHVTTILDLIDKTIFAHEAFDPATASDTITLCLTDMGEFALLPALMQYLQTHAPNMNVRTINIPDERLVEIMGAGGIDLLIAGPIGNISELKQQKIFEHELVALVHPECPLPDILTADDYVSLPHIILDSPMIKRVSLDDMLTNMGLWRDIKVRTANALVQPFLLKSHPRLIATVTHLFAQQAAVGTDLRVLRFDFEMPKVPVYQYWHERFDKHGMSLWLRGVIQKITAELSHSLRSSPFH